MEYYEYSPLRTQNIEDVPREWLHSKYLSVWEYGIKNFSQDANFNAYFGYMIKIRPELLPGPQGFLEWEEKGKAMMRYAHVVDPKNIFTEAISNNADATISILPFRESCKKLWKEVTAEELGDSAVQSYFFRILNGDAINK